ncbi:MAG: hypothetical protein ABR543_04885 [Gemmatimonadaceae bacterium]
MRRSWSVLWSIGASALVAHAACAQQRATPGVRFRDKIVVTAYVTLSDDQTAYYPLVGYRVIIYRSASDSVVLITDASGVATTLLQPGDYRIVSAVPAEWRGGSYSWNLPLSVFEGMGVADLSRQNAIAQPVVDQAVARGPAPFSPTGSVAKPQLRRVVGYKDPTTATLFAFLLTGAGHMYAGEGAKGGVMLATSVGALVLGVALSGSSCDASGDCSVDTAPFVAGALTSLGIWIYGMADAGPAAQRQNVKNGLTVGQGLTLSPVAKTGRDRSMLLGVNFSGVRMVP